MYGGSRIEDMCGGDVVGFAAGTGTLDCTAGVGAGCTDAAGFAVQLNEWEAHVEMKLFAFNDRSTHNYSELRNAVLMQGAEL